MVMIGKINRKKNFFFRYKIGQRKLKTHRTKIFINLFLFFLDKMLHV